MTKEKRKLSLIEAKNAFSKRSVKSIIADLSIEAKKVTEDAEWLDNINQIDFADLDELDGSEGKKVAKEKLQKYFEPKIREARFQILKHIARLAKSEYKYKSLRDDNKHKQRLATSIQFSNQQIRKFQDYLETLKNKYGLLIGMNKAETQIYHQVEYLEDVLARLSKAKINKDKIKIEETTSKANSILKLVGDSL